MLSINRKQNLLERYAIDLQNFFCEINFDRTCCDSQMQTIQAAIRDFLMMNLSPEVCDHTVFDYFYPQMFISGIGESQHLQEYFDNSQYCKVVVPQSVLEKIENINNISERIDRVLKELKSHYQEKSFQKCNWGMMVSLSFKNFFVEGKNVNESWLRVMEELRSFLMDLSIIKNAYWFYDQDGEAVLKIIFDLGTD